MEDQFIPINVTEYVKLGLENGTLIPRTAEKFSRIMARPGVVGEQVATYSAAGILETVNQVGVDPQTNKPDWIVSKIENGEVLIDDFGNRNEWIVNDVKFRTKYEIDPENPTLFKPKGKPQQLVQISDDISFQAPWGETMYIAKGGVPQCHKFR